MSAQTAIEWADSTVNFWFGCTSVSPACNNCYAEARMDKRLHKVEWGAGKPRKRTAAKYWRDAATMARKPFHECADCGWRGDDPKTAGGSITDGMLSCPSCDSLSINDARRRIFSLSLGDWLDNEVPIEWFVEMLDTIRTTPESDWLLLTKRIGNLMPRLRAAGEHSRSMSIGLNNPLSVWINAWHNDHPPANVWIGATVVNQDEADRDVPKLLAVPAAVRFLSIEPMLGSVDLTTIKHTASPGFFGDALHWHHRPACIGDAKWPGLDWIICGGESGPHARPLQDEWARGLRDQCEAAGVPFLFKQWGEWHPLTQGGPSIGGMSVATHTFHDGRVSARLGKKAAGRQLDGRTHDGFPGGTQ